MHRSSSFDCATLACLVVYEVPVVLLDVDRPDLTEFFLVSVLSVADEPADC